MGKPWVGVVRMRELNRNVLTYKAKTLPDPIECKGIFTEQQNCPSEERSEFCISI